MTWGRITAARLPNKRIERLATSAAPNRVALGAGLCGGGALRPAAMHAASVYHTYCSRTVPPLLW